MFTGIIECLGVVLEMQRSGTNVDIWVTTPVTHEMKVDQSVAHNGVCLTIVAIENDAYKVTAVEETINKTTVGTFKQGEIVNIERCLKVGGRLDGHFVQGHVDATAKCIKKETLDGSWLFHFSFPKEFAPLIIEKGSVCINGVSLTAFNVTENTFIVTIIPYTYYHTNFQNLQPDQQVNIEFDVLGKYMLRMQSLS